MTQQGLLTESPAIMNDLDTSVRVEYDQDDLQLSQ